MATKPKNEAKKSNTVVRPYKTTILATFTGTTSLLFNPSTDKLVETLRSGITPGKDMRPAIVVAGEKLLKNDDDNYLVPRSWVFACLREAGRNVSYKSVKDRITSATQGTKLPSLMEIHHAGYVIRDGQGKPMTDWAVDQRKGNNPNSGKGKGVATALIRPRFDVWSIEVEMTIRTDRIDLDRIVQLLEVAGEQYGLGDGRPGMGKLDFGMFQVTRVQVLGTQKAPPRLVIEGLEKLTEEEESDGTAGAEATTVDEAPRKDELVPA